MLLSWLPFMCAVINHGIDKAVIEGMFQQSQAFYNQPRHVKEALQAPEGSSIKSGWHASGSIKVHKDQTTGDTRVSVADTWTSTNYSDSKQH